MRLQGWRIYCWALPHVCLHGLQAVERCMLLFAYIHLLLLHRCMQEPCWHVAGHAAAAGFENFPAVGKRRM
jgi:hypothetical protein